MKKTKTTTSFPETCIKCNKSMRSDSGKLLGGMTVGLSFEDESAGETTCWECFLSKQD